MSKAKTNSVCQHCDSPGGKVTFQNQVYMSLNRRIDLEDGRTLILTDRPDQPVWHALKNANGIVGKTAVVGMKDQDTNTVQAVVVERTNQETLQAFVNTRKVDGAKVYRDEHGAYVGLDNHEVVKHSVGEYVKEQAHTNGIESFWSMLKRGYVGTYHKMSVKHLDRYVGEFAGRHNARPLDTLVQMECIAQGLVGKSLRYQDVIGG